MTKKRLCIKCDEPMKPLVVVGVEIDRCDGCGGLWLDNGEIKALAAHPGDALEQLRAVDGESASVNPTEVGRSEEVLEKPCPACAGKLVQAAFGQTVVELCNACSGIYIDRGELQKTIELVDTTEATTIVALAKSVETSGTI